MKDDLRTILDQQGYRIYGGHAAVKLCHWMKESMLHGRQCYKQDFYGIKSHRCLQMTPVVNDCTHNCLFCWRVRGFESTVHEWKEPEEMLDTLIEQQRKLVSGFKGDPRCTKQMWDECREPKPEPAKPVVKEEPLSEQKKEPEKEKVEPASEEKTRQKSLFDFEG